MVLDVSTHVVYSNVIVVIWQTRKDQRRIGAGNTTTRLLHNELLQPCKVIQTEDKNSCNSHR